MYTYLAKTLPTQIKLASSILTQILKKGKMPTALQICTFRSASCPSPNFQRILHCCSRAMQDYSHWLIFTDIVVCLQTGLCASWGQAKVCNNPFPCRIILTLIQYDSPHTVLTLCTKFCNDYRKLYCFRRYPYPHGMFFFGFENSLLLVI